MGWYVVGVECCSYCEVEEVVCLEVGVYWVGVYEISVLRVGEVVVKMWWLCVVLKFVVVVLV